MQIGKMAHRPLMQFLTTFILYSIVFLTFAVLSDATCTSSLFKLYNDRYLPDHVIKTAVVTSQIECTLLCLRKDECESLNLYKTPFGLNCELNTGVVEVDVLENGLLRRDGSVFSRRINVMKTEEAAIQDEPKAKNISYIFTTLGTEGHNGPVSTAEYQSTSLEGQVTLQNGIQEWRVPYTGTYMIESLGASGANGTCAKDGGTLGSWQRGGLGAKLSGKFFLLNRTLLKILVGQRGIMNTDFNDRPGGGGGGSFVTYANNTPLLIAGGGGGGGGCKVILGESDGDAGQLGVLGSRCNSRVAGNGGLLCSNQDGFKVDASSGAGLLGDGNGDNINFAMTPKCFVNGGTGGQIHILSNGGFGGGGYGFLFGGGGGGYTGGGVWANTTTGVAGGGGSVNYGFDNQTSHGNSLAHGLVKVIFIG